MLAYLGTLLMLDCKLPKSLTFFFVGNVVIFLYLFADFYRKAYGRRHKKAESVTASDADQDQTPRHSPSSSKSVQFRDVSPAGVSRRHVQLVH